MRARWLLIVTVFASALGVGACILGPKQDDPADQTGTIDSGAPGDATGGDTASSSDTGRFGVDAAVDARADTKSDSPAADSGPGDTPADAPADVVDDTAIDAGGDTTPPGDAGGAE